jgi:hypothetical protein
MVYVFVPGAYRDMSLLLRKRQRLTGMGGSRAGGLDKSQRGRCTEIRAARGVLGEREKEKSRLEPTRQLSFGKLHSAKFVRLWM